MASLRDALSEVRRQVSLSDLLHLSPPGAVAAIYRYARAREAGELPEVADALAARDPELLRALAEIYIPFAERYHRWRVVGIEHVPATGGALLVGNHGGGTMSTDGYLTATAIYRHFGVERTVNPLVHDLMLTDPVMRRILPRLGVLRAGADDAARALAAGNLVLVYPAADREAVRPFRERNVVDLAGRTGFARLARQQKVPVVPVVASGVHEQLIVLTRGERLARLVGARRWMRTDSFPLVLALPWGLTSGYIPYMPLPTQITIAFGEPLDPPAGRGDAPLRRFTDELTLRMQAMLDELTADRVPLLGWRSPGRRRSRPSPRPDATGGRSGRPGPVRG